MNQVEKIKNFVKDAKGTNLNVWREVIAEKFGVKISIKSWEGVLMDVIYSMVLGVAAPGNKLGKDFDAFENKTIKVYSKNTGLKAGGDIRISNVLFDSERNNSYNDSLLKNKSLVSLFNLHVDGILVDFRMTNVSSDILENEYSTLLTNFQNGSIKTDPKSRKCEFLNIKYHPKTGDGVFAWRGGKMMEVSDSIVDDSKNVIENQKDYILSLVEKYNMAFVAPITNLTKTIENKALPKREMFGFLLKRSGKVMDLSLMTEILQYLEGTGVIA